MKLLLDICPILLFFAAYYLYVHLPPEVVAWINQYLPYELAVGDTAESIYFATIIATIAAAITVVISWTHSGKPPKNHLITLVLFIIFGGITLALHNPIFIKWKPTVINLLFGAVFMGSLFVGKKTLAERIMGHAVTAPQAVWRTLTWSWVGFFVFSAVLNLYVAYYFSEEFWVNYKLFGQLGLTFVFIIGQSLYLGRYLNQPSEE